MVGLGETPAEVEELMDDLIFRPVAKSSPSGNTCSQPTNTIPVAAYITPEQFAVYKEDRTEERVRTSGKRTISTLLVSCRKTCPI